MVTRKVREFVMGTAMNKYAEIQHEFVKHGTGTVGHTVFLVDIPKMFAEPQESHTVCRKN